ncbi:MAG TPA: ABC transporter substrate-binding protein [Acidimicrobiia bacterium]|nr:ABC transporter substrate-binding protein [Acidimicrobiia bacterium]
MTRFRSRRLIAGIAVGAIALGACGGSSSPSSTGSGGGGGTASTLPVGSRVLKLAFNANMQVPDPDIFYEVEGNEVTTSVYEGLVRYKPDSAAIEGALADSWTVSPDGMTYTFKLHPGVKFHDGTAANAAAWVVDFKRRTDVNSAPAYMLADVKSTAAPDPVTFVVKLKNPVSAFLDYLAAPYGPKGVSPAILAAHAGKDFAQNYLKDHDAGTGPYTITKFTTDVGYELTRFDGYWGTPKPYFEKVEIAIIPDITQQRLKLESGEIDMMIHGLPIADSESFRTNPKFQVLDFPVALKTVLATNPHKGPFKNRALAKALRTFFDKAAIVKEVYKTQANVSTQMYPVAELAPDLAKDTSTYDTSVLTNLAKSLPASDKNIDFAYSQDEGGTLPRLAELLAAKLQAAGFSVKVRGLPIAEVFDLPNHPEKAPDLLLWTFNPDAMHPDTWVRIFMNGAGAINYLKCSDPQADAAMDNGLKATTTAEVAKDYGQAGDLLAASGCFITLADNREIVVARKGLTGFVHQLPTAYTIRLKDLKEG